MNGLGHLMTLLTIVKRDGLDGAFSEDVCYFGRLSNHENITFQPYNEPLRSLRYSLEDVKLCMEALNSIRSRLTKRIRDLQKRCKPSVLADGIERIPDEILAGIFESGHQTSEHSKFPLRVSRVSRRFRQVSFRTPSIWTRLSSRHPGDQIEAFISRSGQCDLHVELWDPPLDELRSSLKLIAPHSCRWSSIWVFNNEDPIMNEIGVSSFPRLRYIYHYMELPRESSRWDMPLLTQFDGYWLTFSPRFSVPFLTQLTCMKLCFTDDCPFDRTSLEQALHRTLNLRELSIKCHDFHPDRDADLEVPQPMSPPDTPRPRSVHIESLKIMLRGSVSFYAVKLLYSILQYLSPSLVDISLLLHGDPENCLIHNLFPYGPTIQLQIGLPCSLPHLLSQLLRNDNGKIVNSLQFRMSSFDCELGLSPEWTHFRPLRHLRFQNCVMLKESHVEKVARRLLACEDFQSLEIISCRNLSEEFLLDLQDEVGERLTWSL
ncbi:hypothetical protein BD410DRAFT_902122 [Rickenella mellea]|uniref:F-box domain-containing protein n=1 Tax=Rickenella mellea TaxID=50990 RepID=A0A4Y7PLE3_9AGAM|nr:hypothetical protein BD410DRAFT_902122 [Rickenella mellea]